MRPTLLRASPLTTVIYGATIVFILLELIVIARTRMIYWDEAVFLSMGKYFATGGASGLWETLRPPVLPLFLSVLYPTGLTIVIAKIVCVLLAALAAFLFYDLLRGVVREELAAGATLLLLFAQVWFSYANLILTDVLSISLVLIAAWFYARERYWWTGIIAATAFLVRFPTGLFLGALVVVLLWQYSERKQSLRPLAVILCGFIVPVLCWFGVNWWLWHAPGVPWHYALFRPLIDGFRTAATDNVGIYLSQPGYYVRYALLKLPIVVFAGIGLWHVRAWRSAAPLCVFGIGALLFFEWLPNDQLRFFIAILPGLLALTAIGVAAVLRYPATKWIAGTLFMITFALALSNAVGLTVQERPMAPQTVTYYTYLNEHTLQGPVLITHPLAAWYLDHSVVPAYFGLFTERADEIATAGAVLLETENIRCGTAACAVATKTNVDVIEEQFTAVYTYTTPTGTHTVYIRY